MIALKVLGKFTRWLWLLLAAIVIGYAVIVVLGRSLLPSLDNYRPQVTQQLSGLLGVDVQVQRLSGTWPSFAPTLSADGVSISAREGDGIEVGKISAELDPFESLWRGQLIWKKLSLSAVTIQLSEDSSGRWSVAGFPLGGGGGGLRPMDMLLYSSLINVDSIALSLNFYSGAALQLDAENILVENSDDFHRILAGVTSGDEKLASFVFEATGDYGDPESFDANAYMQIEQLDLASFDTIFTQLLPDYAKKISALEAGVKTRLWLDIAADGHVEMVGELQADELPLGRTMALPGVRQLRTQLTGWYQPGNDWGVALQSLQFDWGEQTVAPLDIRFRERVGDRWGEFSVDVNYLSVDALRQLALNSELLPEKVARIIAGLNPTGHAERVSADVLISKSGPPSVVLKAQLRDAGIDSYRGAPAASGVDGYLETTASKGILALDTRDASLHFAYLFDQAITPQQVTGTLSWQWDSQRSEVSLFSSPLHVIADEGNVNGQFYLQLPVERPDDAPQLFLQLGVRNSHSRYRDRFVPTLLSPKLLHWLNTALVNIDIPQAGVIFRGSLRKGQGARRTLQIYLQANGERLQYQPDWPALQNFTGELLYHGGQLEGQIASGTMGGMTVTDGTVTLDALGDQVLAISATGKVAAAEAFALLSDSPLREPVSGLAGWQLNGDLDAVADLRIPLKGDWRDGKYQLAAKIADGKMAQPDYQLVLDGIKGQLNYSLKKGLNADKLTARLWGMPASASLATVDDKLQLDVQGKLQVVPLASHFGWALRDLVSGESDYRAQVVLTGQHDSEPDHITLNSNLRGIAVELPAPFGKQAVQTEELQATLTLADIATVTAQYGHSVRAGAELTAEGQSKAANGQILRRGYMGINRSDLKLPDEQILLLAADVSSIDLVDWQSSVLSVFSGDDPADRAGSGQADFSRWLPPIGIDVRVGELGVSALKLNKVHLTGSLVDSVLRTRLESPDASGRLDIPLAGDSEITIALNHLQLPQWQQNSLTDAGEFDPRSLRNMQFSVDKLLLGERQLGRAAFRLQAADDGLFVDQLYANLLGINIGAENNPASMYWKYDGAEHYSNFNGTLQTTEISTVLNNFGLDEVIKSRDATFQSGLQWLGRPWEINRNSIAGQVTFELEKGIINQAAGGGANAFMRLVGLFNFGTWVRRLKLDFSDVFKKGLSYDKISGSLIFDRGTLSFPEPIVAKTPSGVIKMYGDINLINEQIDAQLVATLPVGTNLPWVAALAVNLPTAAGTWVISKIFKRQVNKLSSISYKIEGSWDDPDFEIEKVFSDKNTTRKKQE